MTTTEDWAVASRHGNIYIDGTRHWTLAYLEGVGIGADREGWYLFGPGTNGVLLASPGDSHELGLRLASRAADDYIARPRRP